MLSTKSASCILSALIILSSLAKLSAQPAPEKLPNKIILDNQKCEVYWSLPHQMTALTFSPDQKSLIFSSGINTGFSSFNWKTGQLGEPHLRGSQFQIHTSEIVFSPANHHQVVTTAYDGTKLRDYATGKILADIPVVPMSEPAFGPDGSRLFIAGSNGNVTVWDAKKQELVSILSLPRTRWNRLTVSPDGKRLAASGKETIRIWDTESLKLTHTIPVLGYNHHLAFRPDSDELIISGPVTEGANGIRNKYGMGVLIVDLKKNKLRTTIPFSEFLYEKSYGLVVSPDGKYAYVTFGSGFGVLDLVNGVRKGFVKDRCKMFRLLLSSDGKTLICWVNAVIMIYSTEKLLALDPMTPEQVKKAYFPDY